MVPNSVYKTNHLSQVGIGDGIPDGLCEEDMAASHATLQSLAESINADLSLLREKQVEASTFNCKIL